MCASSIDGVGGDVDSGNRMTSTYTHIKHKPISTEGRRACIMCKPSASNEPGFGKDGDNLSELRDVGGDAASRHCTNKSRMRNESMLFHYAC
jgi:hypothetical protein